MTKLSLAFKSKSIIRHVTLQFHFSAVICAKCLSMRRPDNKKHVTLYECDKTKDVLKKTSKALKLGVKFVYSKLSLDKKSSDDHSISKVSVYAALVYDRLLCSRY